MIIEILLNASYGTMALTPEMKKIMESCKGKGRVEWRIQLAEYVKKNAIKTINLDSEGHPEIYLKKKNPSEILMVELKEGPSVIKRYYLYDRELDMMKALRIETIDTSKPWGIREYDGIESAYYFDIETIDKKYNLCRIKN